MAAIYEIYGGEAHTMTMELMEAARVAEMIPEGASVALKPNLVLASAPDRGATTHAGVLSGAIEYLQGHGVTQICIIEGSWVGDDTGRAMKAAGYDKIVQKYHVPFFDLKADETQTVKTPLRQMEVCRRALNADFFINLPVLKGHCQTAMTCALKNLKGCIPDKEKRRFHAEGLMAPIGALASALRADLTIVDSICGDLNFEEGGTPVQTNRMLLGTDPVQIDAYGCRLMGLSLSDVPYIELAEQWGAGSIKIRPEDLVQLNKPTQSQNYTPHSGTVARLTRRVRADGACSACWASLVRALYQSGQEIPVAIGQGWKGKPFEGLGVGNCCSGAAHFVKGCPPTAQDIAKVLCEMGETK